MAMKDEIMTIETKKNNNTDDMEGSQKTLNR